MTTPKDRLSTSKTKSDEMDTLNRAFWKLVRTPMRFTRMLTWKLFIFIWNTKFFT